MRGFIAATLAATVLGAWSEEDQQRWDRCMERGTEDECKMRMERDGDRDHDHGHDRGHDLWDKCMEEKQDYEECERQKTEGYGYWEGVEWEGRHEMDIYDGMSFLMGDAASKITATAAVVAAAALAVSI